MAISNCFVIDDSKLSTYYKKHGFFNRNLVDKKSKPIKFTIRDLEKNEFIPLEECHFFPGDTDVF